MRNRLRIRLAADAWVDALRHREIARPVAEDLHAVLMISIDEGATSVPPDGQIQQVLSYQDGGLEPVRRPDFKEMLPELGPAVATTEAYDIS